MGLTMTDTCHNLDYRHILGPLGDNAEAYGLEDDEAFDPGGFASRTSSAHLEILILSVEQI